MPGRSAAQQRANATRAHRRQVHRLHARGRVSHAINAAVLPEQGAAADALLDLLGSEAGAHELRTSNDPVGRCGQLAEHLLHGGRPWLHCNQKVTAAAVFAPGRYNSAP